MPMRGVGFDYNIAIFASKGIAGISYGVSPIESWIFFAD